MQSITMPKFFQRCQAIPAQCSQMHCAFRSEYAKFGRSISQSLRTINAVLHTLAMHIGITALQLRTLLVESCRRTNAISCNDKII